MSSGHWAGVVETRRERAVFLTVVVVCVVGALAVAASGTVAGENTALQAENNDSSPPSLHSAEKVNTTAVNITLVDDTGIQRNSIAAGDFLLTAGKISHVRAKTVGSNATVTVVLKEPIQADKLTVGLSSASNITDINGTQIAVDEGESVTVTGMDGVPPDVLGTDVTDALGGPAKIEFRFDEQLETLDVEISGPENVTLDLDDFENPRANQYVMEYEPPESGKYAVSLEQATDTAGNNATFSIVRNIEADRSGPNAVIGLDFGASAGVNVTLDGSQSSGERLTYRWDFGDGTTDSGERVVHEFTPKQHTVTLTVEDEFGNTDVDQLELNLTDGLDSGESVVPENETTGPVVIIDRDNAGGSQSSLVSVTGTLADERLNIGTVNHSKPPLLKRDAITLDRLSILPTVSTSFSVALSAVGAGAVLDGAADNETAVGGFTLLSDLRPAEIAGVEFTFSIDSERLETLDISPEDIELRRNVDGEWTHLDTTTVNETDSQYQFNATTPGFSRFGIVATTPTTDETDRENGTGTDNGTDTGSTTIQVTDARVETPEIEAGDTARVTATVENSGEQTGRFRAGLELNGSVSNTTAVDVAAGDTETVTFSPRLNESGSVAVAVNGTTAGTVTVQATTGNESGGEDEFEVSEELFSVIDVSLNESSIAPGDTVLVDGSVRNDGEESANFIAELAVDGEVVDTSEVPQVPGGAAIPVTFTRQFNETGTYNISISGNQSQSQLEVGQSGGPLSFLPLGFLPLGILPLGLLQTVVTFVGIPLVTVYLLLKSVAFYLGY
ncbi:PKD domain-containing protein [Halovenus rubra]|uniref:PKD domain-containing protein n=2 Tax=Halovenus rubra TaxID=869890 RepID=A0ACC7E4E6_9EURY|nr:PKD domain-containing protein [Halovenus rubra]